MRISVVLCTYNGAPYRSRQLSSIAAESRLPDEVIVSDDSSTDTSVKIVEAFAGAAPFPVDIAVNDRRLGVTLNFERAVWRCTGDVIVLCDQDDVWLPHRVEVVEERLVSEPETAIVFSDAFLINEAGRRTGDRLWGVVGFGPRQQARLHRDPFGQLMGRSIVSGCTLAFRSTHLALLLPFPPEHTTSRMRVLHDRWISLVLASTFGIAVIDEPLVEYRLHPRQRVGIPALQIRRLVPSSMLRWQSAAVPTSRARSPAHREHRVARDDCRARPSHSSAGRGATPDSTASTRPWTISGRDKHWARAESIAFGAWLASSSQGATTATRWGWQARLPMLFVPAGGGRRSHRRPAEPTCRSGRRRWERLRNLRCGTVGDSKTTFQRHEWNRSFTWQDRRGPFHRVTHEQAAQFDRDGYVVIEDLLDADTVAAAPRRSTNTRPRSRPSSERSRTSE